MTRQEFFDAHARFVGQCATRAWVRLRGMVPRGAFDREDAVQSALMMLWRVAGDPAAIAHPDPGAYLARAVKNTVFNGLLYGHQKRLPYVPQDDAEAVLYGTTDRRQTSVLDAIDEAPAVVRRWVEAVVINRDPAPKNGPLRSSPTIRAMVAAWYKDQMEEK